jgi:hypothetical protein
MWLCLSFKHPWNILEYCVIFFSLALQPPLGSWHFFTFMIIFTDDRIPWMGDQLAARPLPKHRTTQTQNKHIHTPNIHALCGIRIHDSSFRASEDNSCLRPRGHCDRHCFKCCYIILLMIRVVYGHLHITAIVTATSMERDNKCSSGNQKITCRFITISTTREPKN